MTSTTTSWTPDELALLAGRQSLILTVGDEASDEVEIGMVVVDDQLYVRAYSGPRSRWYQASREHGRGRIRIDDVVRDVTLHTDDPGPLEQIDQAFIAKYGTAAAGLVTSTAAREATIRIASAS
ncbi:DUF2255 family protein [Catenulispora sp. GP43]|uniref:DUF2255 family protein n=1 Tax=Catenulispora sp. GP43 TaxID=3156263 RepID=UPI0035111114